MSMSMLQYPPYVQVANTYYYHGAPMNTGSEDDIATLASQMRAARIEEEQAQTDNHQFRLQYE